MAALLAVGPDAAAERGWSAACLLGLVPDAAGRCPRRPFPGARLRSPRRHRDATAPRRRRADVLREGRHENRGARSRTLLALASTLPERRYRRAVHEAQALGLVDAR